MTYANFSGRSFTTGKMLKQKRELSTEARARKAYIRNHAFSVQIDSSTGKAEVVVTEQNRNEQ